MDKIREEFIKLSHLPSEEGESFAEEMQIIDPDYSFNYAEGFYYGYTSRDEEIKKLRDAIREARNYTTPMGGSMTDWYNHIQEILGRALYNNKIIASKEETDA